MLQLIDDLIREMLPFPFSIFLVQLFICELDIFIPVVRYLLQVCGFLALGLLFLWCCFFENWFGFFFISQYLCLIQAKIQLWHI